MRCNFSELCSWEKRAEKKLVLRLQFLLLLPKFLTIYISWHQFFQFFHIKFFACLLKNILRQDQIMDYALLLSKLLCFWSIFSPSNAFWMWNNFFFHTLNSTIVLIAFFKCLGKLLFSWVIRPERVHFLLPFFLCLLSDAHTESICFHFNGSNTNPLPFSTITTAQSSWHHQWEYWE